MNFEEAEKVDGVRLSWNVWPTTRLEQLKMILPLGILYTPLNRPSEVYRCDYPPLICRNNACSSILSPWCDVDLVNKLWVCPLCLTRNTFPISYSHISQQHLPTELNEECTTIEYEVKSADTNTYPTFLFVIDTALPEDELEQVKASVIQALTLLPSQSMVGLITFGKHVSVHEIGFTACTKCIVFRGNMNESQTKVFNVDRIKHLLEINPQDEQTILKYLQPIIEIQDVFEEILDELVKDPWVQKPSCRPPRCTGVAITVAVALLECAIQGYPGRVIVFTGGASTIGCGKMIGPSLAHHLRGHRDIVNGKAPLYDISCKYYAELANRCVSNGHIIDIFACSLDQVGIAEQRSLVDKTGGILVLSDTFTTNVFQESFSSIFLCSSANDDGKDDGGDDGESDEILCMCFNGEIRVRTSRQMKVSGCIGPVSSMKEISNCVSTHEIGIGGTSKWSVGGILPQTTLSFMFDIASNQSAEEDDMLDNCGYIQFVTSYTTSVGSLITRVTTIGITFANPVKKEGLDQIIGGFDQEASAVLLARLATHRADVEFQPDLMRWVDHQLIKLVSKFAIYQKGDPDSFKLPQEFLLFPQFMYYLRRSQFIQVFNYSPDETAFFRSTLIRESTANGLSMIQPLLHAYDLEAECAVSVNLELSSRHPDRILLLDTFFHLVIYYGRNVAQWRDDKIWESDDEYLWFYDLLQMARDDCADRAEMRFPYPNIIECDEDSGQQRFLIAKLNPDVDADNNQSLGDVWTDDVSLKLFMTHLKKLAVNPQ